jgi:DNA modification methylase
MATIDLDTVGTKSTGLLKPKLFTGGRKSHMIKTHPAAFPVELPAAFIRFLTNQNEVVFEPFCGSGTVLIACERLKRKCRAIELDPGYVAVSLQRMFDATGDKPQLL